MGTARYVKVRKSNCEGGQSYVKITKQGRQQDMLEAGTVTLGQGVQEASLRRR